MGDLQAINAAYPRFKPDQYQNRADLRNVDSITSPSIYLLKIIPEFQKRSSLPKLEVADSIAPHLDIETNRSISFIRTMEAIKSLVE